MNSRASVNSSELSSLRTISSFLKGGDTFAQMANREDGISEVRYTGSILGTKDTSALGGSKPGPKTSWRKSIEQAIMSMQKKPLSNECYVPIPLSDDECGVNIALDGNGISSFDCHQTRHQFQENILMGLRGIFYGVFYRKHHKYPAFLAVFRIPNTVVSDHAVCFTAAADKGKQLAPSVMKRDDALRFNRLMKNVAKLDSKTVAALQRLLFDNESACAQQSGGADLLQFLLDISNGEIVSFDLFHDMREFNSRGGQGIGTTKFEVFFAMCRQILHNEHQSAAQEQRHGTDLYMSNVLLVRDLIDQVKKWFQSEVDSSNNDRTSLPPIPSESMVLLQFSANNEYARTSACLTGALNIVRACQMQILKKEHTDLHVARVVSKYILAWVVELHNKDG
ncbi:hypothetical protein ACA910_007576 [Epithemia clementina (nom. ined.)]